MVSRYGLCCDILDELDYCEHPLPDLAHTTSSLSIWGLSWSIRDEQGLFITVPRVGEATFLEFRLAEMKAGEVRAGAAEPHPHREGLGQEHQRDTGTKRDILPGALAKPGQTQ